MRAVQALGELGPHELVIRGVDDSPDALAAAVHRAVAAAAATRLIGYVANSLRGLPPTLSTAIEAMFHRPERVRSVSELAAASHTTRRSFDRWLARAGLAPARTLLACARANAAFHILTTGRLRRGEAAALVGYSSARSLARELNALTGWSQSTKQERLTEDEFAAALGRRLVRCPIQSSVAASSH
jgi:transcriptional regulator GlxA family with amidase domain